MAAAPAHLTRTSRRRPAARPAGGTGGAARGTGAAGGHAVPAGGGDAALTPFPVPRTSGPSAGRSLARGSAQTAGAPVSATGRP